MPKGTDPFWKYVKLLPNKRWSCNFCGNMYAGSATRIKAHLAGVGGYGINDCKDVDGQVRSEARKAFKGARGVAESSKGSERNVEMDLHPMPAQSSDPDFWRDMVRALIPEDEAPTINVPRELSNGAEGNIEEGPHQPVITSNEDGPREISFADMPYLNSNAMSTIVASSSNFLLHEMNVPSQYLPTQNMTTHGDISSWTQPPQSHAGDSNIEPQNLSNPSSGGDLTPEALTNMPHPVNAEEGEPNTEVPQVILTELSNGAEGNVGEGLPVTVNDEDVGGDTAFDYSTFFDFTNTEASASMPHPWNAEEEEPNTYVRLVEQNSSQPYDLELSASRNYFFRDKHERHITIESCHSIPATIDGEIGGDGRALLRKNVQVLVVGRCSGVTSLCEVGPLNNLEELKIVEWEKLEELGAVHFPRLRRLNITRCTKLKHFLKEGHELRFLQWFKIEDSEELEEINIAAPFLYSIEVYECPKMKWVVKWQWLATHLPNLRSIKIKDCEQLEEIVGGLPPIGATCSLTEIDIEGCNNLKGVLMTHNVAFNLPFLQYVMVEDCMGIEAIIGIVPNMTQPLHLTNLTLTNLPELKTICEGTVSWLSIQYMRISECPKLKRLPLLDKGPYYDDDIAIYNNICIDELTWQSLEWDHYPFHPSLQHLAKRYGVSNWHDQRICVRIESRHAITARVDGLIGGDGRNLLPRNVQVLEVGGGSGVTSLSEVGPLEILEELIITDCEKLEELGAVHFPQLEALDINWCSKLKRLSVEGQGLPHLRWFAITGSEELEGIDLAAPNLNFMEVRCCSKMKRVVEWDWLTTRLPNLKSIGLIDCEELKEIIGGPLPIGSTCLLTKISITRCNNMKGVLLTHDMLLHIPSLQDIIIEDCEGIEVIIGTAPNMTQSSFPKLTRLTLGNLLKLKRICDRMESCDHIQYIEIENCRELKSIPLRLHPLDNGLLSPPASLGRILTHDKKTWQALEWDHPLAPISLEPFVEFILDY